MSDEKYLYCFIKCPEEREFAVDSIGDLSNRVYTINYLDLAAVVSDSPNVKEYKLNKENTTRHESVLGKVLEDFTVLPVGFGTVTEGAEQIREKVLKKNYEELCQLIDEMDGKVELTIKAVWRNNQIIYQEILKTAPGIKSRLNKVMTSGKMELSQLIISSTELGKRLISAIDKIKERQTQTLLAGLEKQAQDLRLKKNYSPLMIFNAAFLVDRAREEKFDRAVEELDQKYGKDIKFIYTGPSAPYSFVDFRIALE